MKAAIFAAALALAGCATPSSVSAAQRLYAALGGYTAALTAATVYAEQAGANPAIVHRLRQANDQVQPAVVFADAYRRCAAGALQVNGTPCVSFDFSKANLLTTATSLRDAALALEERGQ